MPDSVWPQVGGSAAASPRSVLPSLAGGDWRPLLTRMGLQIQWTELVHADDHGRITGAGFDSAVGDRVELQHPVLLDLVVRVSAGLPRLDGLERRRPPRVAASAALRGRCRRPPPRQ